jgi:hypothetical protein
LMLKYLLSLIMDRRFVVVGMVLCFLMFDYKSLEFDV